MAGTIGEHDWASGFETAEVLRTCEEPDAQANVAARHKAQRDRM